MFEAARSSSGGDGQTAWQYTHEENGPLMKGSPSYDNQPRPDEPLQVDSDLSDDGDATSSIDDRTTIVSSIRNYKHENGRRYHSFRDGEYLLPNDDREQDRLDLGHHIFKLILNGDLFRSPIDNPQSALDICTGTGLWAIDFAEQFPGAEVLGTDLSPIQPTWFPSNCRFEVDDAESDWLYGHQSIDYVHARGVSGSIRDWGKLFSQTLHCLRPGGWMEIQEYETVATSDDGTFDLATNFKQWQEKLNEASQMFGKSFMDCSKHKGRLEEAGFVNVTDDVYKVPMGTWPKDKKMKEIGRFQLYQMLEAIEPFSLAVFTRVLKWTPEETRELIDKVKADLCNPKVHMYSRFHFIYGQKPESEN
ncbi:S-adenosyl-L-methionine-dependent methyltransferase [Talaromyces proteolyticus]|uniref:S-adenosyl-L-methionine-dependent methyltransferase n=1 Tax=Talaromyces proteolyticus TaxID=1131652 RepID=A0AAD4Q2M2_9EURO|nr:S-adenosyl-L-methionine-dependent methyltransferase [Talaromyces proteolyticus]KAH8703832.1 S-adenosyl-L-methionine-dependent methyltransferase [Talaromyces proteolyticus]